jgi:tellurite resistance protein TehA-like permease
VVNEPVEPDLRALWQAQPEMERRMSVEEIRARIQSIEKERSRRSAGFLACGAVIVPSWLAVAWFLPDFRVMAAVGLGTALWILYNVYRGAVDRAMPVGSTAGASLTFYRAVLERERALHQRLPSWFLPPVMLSTAAIAVTFYRSARFEHTPVFFAMLAWIVAGSGVALVAALRKSRRAAARCQQELDLLDG